MADRNRTTGQDGPYGGRGGYVPESSEALVISGMEGVPDEDSLLQYPDGLDDEVLYRLPDEEWDVKGDVPEVFKPHRTVAGGVNKSAREPARLSEQEERQLRELGYLN